MNSESPDETSNPGADSLDDALLEGALKKALGSTPKTMNRPLRGGDFSLSSLGPDDRYEIGEEIGRGGMGVVFRARDRRLQRPVAVKILRGGAGSSPAVAQRFLEEAQIAAQLQHPGIVPTHDVGVSIDGEPYIVMKLVGGETMKQRLGARVKIEDDLEGHLRCFLQIAQAVAFAHSRGVAHRDLKPSNVMVDAFGEVYTMDWGLAKVVDSDATRARRSDESRIETIRTGSSGFESITGMAIGTPAYMPPELARGERGDARADVFCLGGILCEILTGKATFIETDSESAQERARKGDLADTFARLDACRAEPDLVALAKACLAALPEQRPANAGQVAQAMADHFSQLELRMRLAVEDAAIEHARAAAERRGRRIATLLAALVVVLTILAAASFWIFSSRAEERAQKTGHAMQTSLNRAIELRFEARARDDSRVEILRTAADSVDEALRIGSAADAPGDVRDRARQLRGEISEELALAERERERRERDAVVASRIASLRVERAAHLSFPKLVEASAEAFASFGFDVDHEEPEAIAERMRSSANREGLIELVDDWSNAITQARVDDQGRTAKLRTIADLADDLEVRKRLRAAFADGSKAAIEEAARYIVWEDLPIETALQLAAMVATRLGRKEAIVALERLVQRNPGDFWVNHDLAMNLDLSNPGVFVPRAMAYYQAAIALEPENPSARINMAYQLLDLGEAAQARLIVDEAIARLGAGSYRASALCCRAMIHEKLGDDVSSEADLRAAIALVPDFRVAHSQLGNLLVRRNRKEDALREFEIAMNGSPSSDASTANRTMLLCELGRAEEGIAAARALTVERPDYAHGFHALGMALQLTGADEEAEKALREAIRLDPQVRDPYLRLAQIRLDAFDYAGGLEVLDGLLRVFPNDVRNTVARAQVLMSMGRPEEASRALQRAVDLGATRESAGVDILPLMRQCEDEIDTERLIRATLAGGRMPTDELEWARLLRLAISRPWRTDEARLWELKIESQVVPGVSQQLPQAARAALLCASGTGEDASKLDATARAHWRERGLDWLSQTSSAWRNILISAGEPLRATILRRARSLLDDPLLQVWRQPSSIPGLSEEEIDRFEDAWDRIADLK